MKTATPARSRQPAFTVREGSSSVVAYKYGDGTAKTADYCLCWYRFPGDKRQRETKTGERRARERAREIATDLANDRSLVTELSGADREAYLRIKAISTELRVSPLELIEQAASAKKRLGAHASLAEAVDSHLQTRRTITGSRATVRVLVDDFMRRKRTQMRNGDLSEVHIEGLAGVLERIAVPLYGDREIVSIQKDELQDMLNERRDRRGNIVGPRRRRHIRECFVQLWNDARDNRHLPQAVKHAAELTARPKVVKEKEPTFEPWQFRLLINSAHLDPRQRALVPTFALGAFGRMRMSEIARLEWPAIHLFPKQKPGKHGNIAGEIDVSGHVAGKTGMARIIDVTPQLAAWLKLYRRPSGHVLNPEITRVDNHVRRFAGKLGIKWKRNVLRGSSTSYLYTVTNDLAYVAAQHGTSERELKREYLERKTREQAEEWNGRIRPEKQRPGSKIVELTPENLTKPDETKVRVSVISNGDGDAARRVVARGAR